MENKQRLLSLDILRGITVAGMILVNNGYGESFTMLGHSRWNGLTPCDLVFPFFLFIVGIACYLSLAKGGFTPTPQTLRRIAKRTVLLFVIGLAINWFHDALKGDPLGFDHLRLWAVMQRIALCYGAVSLIALYMNHRYIVPLILALLSGYTLLLIWGNGYSEDATLNILSRADRSLFGYAHLYHKSPVDPEGLLGTISSIAHVLIGFYCGKAIYMAKSVEHKVMGLFVIGTVCLVAGYLLSFGLPLNKRIWSPSYVLVTCALAALLQALLMWLIDIRQKNRWTKPFCVFGMNALALYVASEVLSIIFSQTNINSLVYNALHTFIIPLKWASLAYALTFVAINYAIGYALYRKQIYIKL